jgi:hypothetical protein
MKIVGLKRLRSGKGVKEPNTYWGRPARQKCGTCERRIRSKEHKCQ